MTIKLTCAVDQVKGLKAAEVKAVLDGDRQNEFALLDVRQPAEFADGHIPGAMLIPLGELEARQGELDRRKKIIVYCRGGHRSLAAAVALCGLGFTGLHHLEGGLLSWPYGVVKGPVPAGPPLVVRSDWPKDILMLAMKLEKGSADFYSHAGEQVAAEEGKRLFQSLASFEERHMRKVYERASRALGQGALPPWDDLKRDLKVEHMEGGIEINPALTRLVATFRDEMDALEIALEKEYLSYDFYQRAATYLDDTDSRVLLHELALEERAHADILLDRLSGLVR